MSQIDEQSIFKTKSEITGRWVEVVEHNEHYHGKDHIMFIVRYDIGGSRWMSSNHRVKERALAFARKLVA